MLLAMVDRFALTALIHAPEVPDELQRGGRRERQPALPQLEARGRRTAPGRRAIALAASDDAVGDQAEEQDESYEAEP